jgi:hypothetical protein
MQLSVCWVSLSVITFENLYGMILCMLGFLVRDYLRKFVRYDSLICKAKNFHRDSFGIGSYGLATGADGTPDPLGSSWLDSTAVSWMQSTSRLLLRKFRCTVLQNTNKDVATEARPRVRKWEVFDST